MNPDLSKKTHKSHQIGPNFGRVSTWSSRKWVTKQAIEAWNTKPSKFLSLKLEKRGRVCVYAVVCICEVGEDEVTGKTIYIVLFDCLTDG